MEINKRSGIISHIKSVNLFRHFFNHKFELSTPEIIFTCATFILMKNIALTLLFCILLSANLSAQFWAPLEADNAAGAGYLTAATHVGDHIFAIGNNQTFVHSSNKGVTWDIPTITKPSGTFAALVGTSDRLYASMKINTFDYEIYYSTDQGLNWTIDTVGLPESLTKTGKAAMTIQYMGNEYVIAWSATTFRYKKLGENTWRSANVDNVVTGYAVLKNKWVALGVQKILESLDNGASWSTISTTGLPENFQGSQIAGNFDNRLFISEAPADGGVNIYFSNDGGSSWSITNATDNFSHSNPWVNKLYAVDDYVFAAINPVFADFQSPPPFLISSTSSPSFVVGDTTGFSRGLTTTSLPFFFHIGDKLFTMMGDLHSSEPGFDGNIATSLKDNSDTPITYYPNPTHNLLFLDFPTPSNWRLTTSSGFEITKGFFTPGKPIDLSSIDKGVYLLTISDITSNKTLRVVKQ